MSQYGAYGFSKHGADYRQILAHYYRDTAIGRRDGGTMRVLLEPNQSAIGFRTAGRRTGSARPEQLYIAKRNGSTVVLRTASGRIVSAAPASSRSRARRA